MKTRGKPPKDKKERYTMMKKILSLLLAICLCAVCFVGCNTGDTSSSGDGGKKPGDEKKPLTVTDIQKDPLSALEQAGAAAGSWATDDAGIGEIVKDSAEKGSVEIYFESASLLAMMGVEGLESITATLYADAAEKQAALEVLVALAEGELANYLYLTKDGIALDSAALLGVPGTYMINVDTLLDAEKFGASFYPMLMGMGEEELAEVLATLPAVKTAYEAILALDLADTLTKLVKAAEGAVAVNVSAGIFKDAAGKSLSCAVLSYTVNEETVKAMCLAAIDALEIPAAIKALIDPTGEMTDAEIREGLKESFLESFEAGLEDAEIVPMTYNYYIDLKSGKLVGMDLISVTVEDETDFGSTKNTVFYTDNGIIFETVSEYEDFTSGNKVVLAKTEKAGVVTYALTVDSIMDAETVNVVNISASYNKASGAIALDLFVEESIDASVSGVLAKTADSASLTFTNVTVRGVEVQEGVTSDVTIDLTLSVTFKKGTPVPTIPEDAIDLTTMSEEEWSVLMEAAEGALLGEIIGSIMGGGDDEYPEERFEGVIKMPNYIPEGLVEEVMWECATDVCYAYVLYDDEEGTVEYSHYFTQFADEESANAWLMDCGVMNLTVGFMTVEGADGDIDVTMFSCEDYQYYAWSDNDGGYFVLENWELEYAGEDIRAIIASVR